jgi:hypothetical protein
MGIIQPATVFDLEGGEAVSKFQAGTGIETLTYY